MAGTEQHEIQGRIVEIPCAVRDASHGIAMYMVDRAAAQKLIPDAFEAVEAEPGQTTLTLIIVDYRDNDLGDYDEVGITFSVKPKGQPEAEPGSYIYKLPVNQDFTCEVGRLLWGFPKTVEEIDFSYADESATCKLEMDGRHVMTLTVPRGGDGKSPGTARLGYTLIEGVPHSNIAKIGGTGEQMLPGGDGVVLELGNHPIADELRSLGLPGVTPILSLWAEHMFGTFSGSTKL